SGTVTERARCRWSFMTSEGGQGWILVGRIVGSRDRPIGAFSGGAEDLVLSGFLSVFLRVLLRVSITILLGVASRDRAWGTGRAV
ncbi:MAG: hypothetical protein ACJAQ3_002915, partial [Planctomycetota bacterium]